MESAVTVARARALLAASPHPLGFVPTMGALHAGHLELVARARERCATVAVSIFVNPLQFGQNEDLAKYPRDLEQDRAMLAGAGADLLFAPEASEMYAADFATYVEPGPLANVFEGAIRPGHFRGVATVIAKLLNIVRPDVLVLGQKDAQQAVLLRKTMADLNVPVELEIVPTVREPDGLAMSSRNRYLDPEQRAAASALHRALTVAKEALQRGTGKADAMAAAMAELRSATSVDYIDVVDAQTFAPIETIRPPAFVIGAAHFGATRLIDNLWISK